VEEYAKAKQVIILKVPPRCTYCCQPADIAWFRPLKQSLRTRWVEFVREQLAKNKYNEAFKMEHPRRKEVIMWLYEAWDAISESTILSGFRKIKALFDVRILPPLRDVNHNEPLPDDPMDQLDRVGFIDHDVGEIDPEQDMQIDI
jgi:DDE superfamily endonuclease